MFGVELIEGIGWEPAAFFFNADAPDALISGAFGWAFLDLSDGICGDRGDDSQRRGCRTHTIHRLLCCTRLGSP